MYRITQHNGAALIGFVDELRYIIRDPASGIFARAFGEHDADGIAVRGTPYNIGDEEKIPGADFVDIDEVDGSEYTFHQQNVTRRNTGDIGDMQQLILEQDNELCLVQEAIMDLDNQLNGKD